MEGNTSIMIMQKGIIATLFLIYESYYRQSLTEEVYATVIGEPAIVWIGDLTKDASIEEEEEQQQANDDRFWGVAIPHLDPASLAFGSRDPRVLRLVFLCWVRSLLLLECCLVALQTTRTNDPDGPGTLAFARNLTVMLEQSEERSDLGERIKEARAAVCDMRGADSLGM